MVVHRFKRTNLPAMTDPKHPVQTERSGIANSDILKCYLGILTLGQNDFEAVEVFRSQRFNAWATNEASLPTASTAQCWACTSTARPSLRLDIDTFVMDQSDMAKEGVAFNYAWVRATAPSRFTSGHGASAWSSICLPAGIGTR